MRESSSDSQSRIAGLLQPSRLLAGALVVLLVSSSIAPFTGLAGVTVVSTVSASSMPFANSVVVDDFEEPIDGGPNVEQSTIAVEGNHSAYIDTKGQVPAGGLIRNHPNKTGSSMYFRIENISDYEDYPFSYSLSGPDGSGGSNQGVSVSIRPDGLFVSQSGEDKSIPYDLQPDTWYQIEISDINFAKEEYEVTFRSREGDELGSVENVAFAGTMTEIQEYWMLGSARVYLDNVTAGSTFSQTPATTDSGTFEHTFRLADQTRGNLFVDYSPKLTIAGPGGATTQALNHEPAVYQRVENGSLYDLTVSSDRAAFTFESFRTTRSPPSVTLTITSDMVTAPTGNFTADIGTYDFDGTELPRVRWSSPDPVEEFDYTIRDPDGDPVYNGSVDYDDPVQSGAVVPNATNVSVGDGYTVDWSAVYDNGSTTSGIGIWNATTSGGIFGPTGGTSSGGGASRIGGYVILAGGAFLAYRRFGNGEIGRAVSVAAKRARGLL